MTPSSFVPRKWQREARNQVLTDARGNADRTLLFACPGAGKTLGALYIAKELRAIFPDRKILVITPNTAIREQWVGKAPELGLTLTEVRNGFDLLDDQLSLIETNFILSYQIITNEKNGLKYSLRRFCELHKPIIILDEVHHSAVPNSAGGGGNDWGEVIEFACAPGSFKLCTTGTPFREKSEKIAFVNYEPGEDGRMEAVASVKYGYERAIRDGVCRPIEFAMFDGCVEWREGQDSGVVTYKSGEADKQEAKGLEAAWSPSSPWCRDMLEKAHDKLLDVRSGPLAVDSRAAGLIVARDIEHASALAAMMEEISGQKPILVHSKIDDAQGEINRFRNGDAQWIVAVSMLSEGVDIQRLRVCIYASNKRASLYFHQVVGRLARVQAEAGSPAAKAERSFFFMVADSELEAIALEIERDKAHALDDEVPSHIPRVTVGKGGRKRRAPTLKVISASGELGATITSGRALPAAWQAAHKDWAIRVRRDSPEYAHFSDAALFRMGIVMGALPKPEGWEDAA